MKNKSKMLLAAVAAMAAVIILASFTGCAGGIGMAESGYMQKGDKIIYFYHAGPLSMFGLNWNRHELELPDVDAATFVDFKVRAYAKDRNHVYHAGVIVDDKYQAFDARTFEMLNDTYAKDKNHVYDMAVATYGIIVEGANPDTFVVTGENTGQDDLHTYKGRHIVE